MTNVIFDNMILCVNHIFLFDLREEFYRPSVSTALWPSDPHVVCFVNFINIINRLYIVNNGKSALAPMFLQEFVLAAFHEKVPSLFSDKNDTSKYRRNLIKLEVQYEDLNYEKITEREGYVVSVKHN